MLLTITSNPAIDRVLHVPSLSVGAIHRTAEVWLNAGGKGLNVARAARTLGQATLITAPLAGHAGRLVADLAGHEGLQADWYWVSTGETRNSLLLTHDAGDATVINEVGPILTREIWNGFAAHVERLAGGARAVAISSSLPPGVPPTAHAELARTLSAGGSRPVYVDTSGAALTEALERPEGFCVKVNRAELSEAFGVELPQQTDVLEAGRVLLRRGATMAVVTLGGEGALAISEESAWHASAPPVRVTSTVGSGDALLAGLAVELLRHRSLEEALAFGVACGSANATTRHPGRFDYGVALELVRQVRITKLA